MQSRFFISCSRPSNSGEEKNSASVISSPSHIIFIVNSFGLQLLPYRIFLMLDGGSAHTVASLLMLMFLCSHRRSILILTASIVCILAS